MWNAIEEVIRRFDTELKPVRELMSFEAQPKDTDTAAVPMLWKFHARSFLELSAAMEFAYFHRNVPPPPIVKRYRPVTAHRVRVNPPSSDYLADRVAPIPKQTAVHTEMDAPVTPAEMDRSPVPVVDVKEPSSVILLAETTPPAVMQAEPTVEIAVTTPPAEAIAETAVFCSDPNPFSGRVPEISGWHDNGRGPRPVVEGTGSMTTCHLCGVKDISRKFGVRWCHSRLEGTEAHLYEMERQKGWYHRCVVCEKQFSGLTTYQDHVCGQKHKRKVKLLGLDKQDYCFGRPACRLKCCHG